MQRAILLSLALLAAVPASAPAATVGLGENPPDKYDGGSGHVTFTAGAAERNDVTLTRDGAALAVRDAGAPLTPGAGCAPVDANTTRCASRFTILSFTGDLRDLDDTFTSNLDPRTYLNLIVFGSDGHDVLSGPGYFYGGAGPDVLTGSAGNDRLAGGAGDDLLRGLEGDDVLSGDSEQAGEAAPGSDLLDGGAGTDTAGYDRRIAGVHVDLADPAPDGQAGERDQLIGIESVVGGEGPDVLAGDAQANSLAGAGGADTLTGRDGRDRLTDGQGADVLLGGNGDDVLSTTNADDRAFGEEGNDSLTGATGSTLDGGPGDDAFGVQIVSTYTPVVCGDGHDALAGAPRNGQRIGLDCEDVHFGVFDTFRIAAAPVRRAGSVFSLAAGCNKLAAPMVRCAGEVTLRLRRPKRKPLLLGRRTYTIPMRSSRFVRVQVRRAARRALARAPRPLIEVDVEQYPFGRKVAVPGGDTVLGRTGGLWSVRLR